MNTKTSPKAGPSSARKPATPPDPAAPDLLDTLHQGKSMLTTPEEQRLINLIKKAKEEGVG